ncbi:MAG: SEC-C metal-binding domain-containing protein [Thermoguttaceae bacterium]|jgi:hypothetical protein|nr:SEC-C metal-binding domain-containing protein [Thermoguttaceae bacterium]
MPLAIEAIEKYGWDDAFYLYYFSFERLPQTEETVLWLIDQLERPQNDENEHLTSWLLEVLANAAPPLLQAHQQPILELDVVDEEMRKAIRDRIVLHGFAPEKLWRELEELCDRNKSEDYPPDEDIDHAHRLVQAMGVYPNVFDARVIELLDQDIEDYSDNPMVWMEPFLVWLAGELRLEQAIPLVLKRLLEYSVVPFSEAMESLAQIGTDAVVDALKTVFQNGDWDFRYHTADIFGIVHTDHSLERCLGLLHEEDDLAIQCRLAQSALMHFADETIQPVRQVALNDELDSDGIELRNNLVAVSTLMGIDFPERAQWQEDAKQRDAFRQGRHTKQHAGNADEEAAYPAEDYDDYDDNPLPPSVTVVHEGPKIGRNDPCPCGSGRKYKKCCLKKQDGSGE